MKQGPQGAVFWLRKVFLNYVWLGIAMILAANILDAWIPPEHRTYFIWLLSDFLTTIGIAISVIALFL
jgi:hypothetical protein